MMELEKNEKVLAMYRAVWALMEEGSDIHTLKVADITSRAGIGKGTAYEYFRSKEELLGKALQYEFMTQYYALDAMIKSKTTMREAVYGCFEWLEKNTDRRPMMLQFIKLAAAQEAEHDSMDCIKKHVDSSLESSWVILRDIVNLGRNEGIIGTEVPDKLAQLELFSKLLSFFAYLQIENPENEQEIQQTKAFLYDNIEKSLK